MDELNAAPSSTEPTAEELASIAMGTNAQGAGTAASAASGESGDSADTAAPNTAASTTSDVSDPGSVTATGDAADDVGGAIDAQSHLMLLDSMLAEIERKIAAGIHLFAHEVTAARDHLGKLL
ncbi:hypothetical protein POK33_08965 [Burkholderia cenocepacia]|uniref:hypothetical protein n=1 Tax=Burkholderia cenocepacia TaxID=95486 RepID=UPI0023B9A311|nr:hypothetical protein [Burkholderia cenocepacia]MDF0500860.1 hypothetical protein [Burkholderia cenocepacia]